MALPLTLRPIARPRADRETAGRSRDRRADDRALGPLHSPTMEIIYFGGVVLGLFIWLFCAYLAYKGAPQRGRRAGAWGILGIFFGPFALFALYLMKPKARHAQGHGQQHDPRADLYEVPKKH